MHEKILLIPQEEINEIHIHLIKGFVMHALPRGFDIIDQDQALSPIEGTGNFFEFLVLEFKNNKNFKK